NELLPDLFQLGHGQAIKRVLLVSESLASRLTNTPAAQAEIRLRCSRAYFELLRDFPAAEQQAGAAETLAHQYTGTNTGLAALARSQVLAAKLWQVKEAASPEAKALLDELRTLGANALLKQPPDREVAAHSLEAAAQRLAIEDESIQSELLAREWLRAA